MLFGLLNGVEIWPWLFAHQIFTWLFTFDFVAQSVFVLSISPKINCLQTTLNGAKTNYTRTHLADNYEWTQSADDWQIKGNMAYFYHTMNLSYRSMNWFKANWLLFSPKIYSIYTHTRTYLEASKSKMLELGIFNKLKTYGKFREYLRYSKMLKVSQAWICRP